MLKAKLLNRKTAKLPTNYFHNVNNNNNINNNNNNNNNKYRQKFVCPKLKPKQI